MQTIVAKANILNQLIKNFWIKKFIIQDYKLLIALQCSINLQAFEKTWQNKKKTITKMIRNTTSKKVFFWLLELMQSI